MASDADAVLRLGRDLADALDRSDVVGRWMAHHLADLITRCEEAPDDDELATMTRDVVFRLWERKRGARFRTEPYGYVRPVLQAIARLDPAPAPWAYYRPFDDEPGAEDLASYPLLRAVCDLDREVGDLVRLGVAVAARDATSREEPWVIAAMDITDTEEDRAARALVQHMRRLSMQAGPDPRTLLAGDDDPDDPPSDEGHGSGNPSTMKSTSAELGTRESTDVVAPRDPLVLALRGAVLRCREVFDRLESQSEELLSRVTEASAGGSGEPGDTHQSSDGQMPI